MEYLATTFSPAMLSPGTSANVVECDLADIPAGLYSIVGHEVTAAVLTALLGEPVTFRRASVALAAGDGLFVVVPNFRAAEAREFTRGEVEAAGFRCFVVTTE